MAAWDKLTPKQQIFLCTTDAGTQRKYCHLWGIPFPGDQPPKSTQLPEKAPREDPNEGNDI